MYSLSSARLSQPSPSPLAHLPGERMTAAFDGVGVDSSVRKPSVVVCLRISRRVDGASAVALGCEALALKADARDVANAMISSSRNISNGVKGVSYDVLALDVDVDCLQSTLLYSSSTITKYGCCVCL